MMGTLLDFNNILMESYNIRITMNEIKRQVMRKYWKKHLKDSGIKPRQFYKITMHYIWSFASDKLAMQAAAEELRTVVYKQDFDSLLK
jgi:hypothetical protein